MMPARAFLIQLQKYIFGLIVFLLPFTALNLKRVRPFFGLFLNGDFLDKPALLVLPLGLLLAVLTQILYGDFFYRGRKALKMAILVWLWFALCETVNAVSTDLSQIVIYIHGWLFLPAELLRQLGMTVSQEQLCLFSYLWDRLYELAAYLVWTWGGAYWVYCLYRGQAQELFRTLVKVGLVIFIFIAAYGLVDLGWILGSTGAEQILRTCNPYLHRIADAYGWWPPLLFNSDPLRLRSIFAEPSYMAIYFAYYLPFLWSLVFQAESAVTGGGRVKHLLSQYLPLLLTFWSFMMLFLTKSRTAYGIMILQLLALIAIFYGRRQREYYPVLKKLAAGMLLAFLISSQITAGSVEELGNMEIGSNNSRLGYMAATALIGGEHPLLGAGSQNFNALVAEHLPAFTAGNDEIQRWVAAYKKNIYGVGYPQICEYTTRWAQFGVGGLLADLLPLAAAFLCLARGLKKTAGPELLRTVLVFLSILGMAASGWSNNFNIVYSYWIILGTAFCVGSKADRL